MLLIAILGIGLVGSCRTSMRSRTCWRRSSRSVAAVVFVIVSEVNWPAAIAIAVGSVLAPRRWQGGPEDPADDLSGDHLAVGIVAIVSLLS